VITKDNFVDWHTSHIDCKYGRIFNHIDQWYEKWKSSHASLLQEFGDTRVHKKIVIGSESEDNPASWIRVEKEIREIAALIPGYFDEYALGAIKMCYSKIPDGKFAGMRWGTHIKHWMKKNKISPEIVKNVEINLSRLGDAWAKAKTTKETYSTLISIDPRDFARIGHYRADSSSCFKHGSTNHIHKYIIGQTPNSFLIFTDVEETDVTDWESTFSVRAWGMFNADKTALIITNKYGASPKGSKKLDQCFDGIALELLGWQDSRRTTGKAIINGVWQNKDTVLYTPANEPEPSSIEFKMDSTGLDSYRKCFKCGIDTGQLHTAERNYQYCDICIASAYIDDFTGARFFNGRHLIYIDENTYRTASAATAESLARMCRYSRRYFLKELVVKDDRGYWINKYLAETYFTCKTCELIATSNMCLKCGSVCVPNKRNNLVEV
jgi:hypothetical protein